MLFKNSCLASIIAISGLLTAPNIALAKDIESYQDYQDYCSPAAYQYGIQSPDCDRYRSIYENRSQQELEQRQIRRRDTKIRNRTRENQSSKGTTGYLGATIGAFFPDADALDTGFGISLYGGAKFNQYFATDLEIDLLGGGTEISGIAYGVFAAFINPKFIFPFDKQENSASVYFSPGIGISALGVGDGDVTVNDDTRLTWQAKAGISVPVSRKLDILGQVRYASQFEEDTVDFFGTEIGLNFEF